MAGGNEDLGIGLRLPWGKIGPPADEAFAPPPPLAEAAEAGPPHDPIAPQLSFEALLEGIDRRFDRLDDRLARLEHDLPERLDLVGARLAEASDADAVGAVLDRRLERLETLVTSFHETTMGTLGRNNDQLVAAFDASQATLIDRLAQLAPADLVARLIEGVVATGEMLDAELIELKGILAGRLRSGQ